MRRTRIAIFAALEWECQPILALLPDAERQQFGDVMVWHATYEARDIWVVRTGIGPQCAGAAARAVVQHVGTCDAWLSTGCAGALTPELQTGDVVLATAFADMPAAPPPDLTMCRTLESAAQAVGSTVHQGVFLSHHHILADTAAKQHAAQRSGAIAVEMESAAIVEQAHRVGIPCGVCRVILDPLAMEIVSPGVFRLAGKPVSARATRAVVRQRLGKVLAEWLREGGSLPYMK